MNNDNNVCCKNIKLLLDIFDLYSEIDMNTGRKSSYIQQKKAYRLSGKLRNIIYADRLDIHSLSPLTVSLLKTGNKYYRNCSEFTSQDCIFALESFRAAVHNEKQLREKLVCKPYEEKIVLDALDSMRQIAEAGEKRARRLVKGLYDIHKCND